MLHLRTAPGMKCLDSNAILTEDIEPQENSGQNSGQNPKNTTGDELADRDRAKQ